MTTPSFVLLAGVGKAIRQEDVLALSATASLGISAVFNPPATGTDQSSVVIRADVVAEAVVVFNDFTQPLSAFNDQSDESEDDEPAEAAEEGEGTELTETTETATAAILSRDEPGRAVLESGAWSGVLFTVPWSIVVERLGLNEKGAKNVGKRTAIVTRMVRRREALAIAGSESNNPGDSSTDLAAQAAAPAVEQITAENTAEYNEAVAYLTERLNRKLSFTAINLTPNALREELSAVFQSYGISADGNTQVRKVLNEAVNMTVDVLAKAMKIVTA